MKIIFIYHYCAKVYLEMDKVKYFDGILETDTKIVSKDDYDYIKTLVPNKYSKNLIITSLSLLHENN